MLAGSALRFPPSLCLPLPSCDNLEIFLQTVLRFLKYLFTFFSKINIKINALPLSSKKWGQNVYQPGQALRMTGGQ